MKNCIKFWVIAEEFFLATVTKVVTNFTNGNETVNELSQEASSLVAQYKNIIREQDHKIQTLNEHMKQLLVQNESITVNFSSSLIFFSLIHFSHEHHRRN